jgi:hypothetical protein
MCDNIDYVKSWKRSSLNRIHSYFCEIFLWCIIYTWRQISVIFILIALTIDYLHICVCAW